jgi:hypothetical protein
MIAHIYAMDSIMEIIYHISTQKFLEVTLYVAKTYIPYSSQIIGAPQM